MRLKKIEPGMVIHCKTQEEANILCDTIGGGLKWKRYWVNHREATCYKISNDGFYSFGIIASYNDSNITEFSDLILPELTEEEVLQICNKICSSTPTCGHCTMVGNCFVGNCFNDNDLDYSKVIEICQQWKSDHEKKEPEIETVDICRIIEVMPDGRKRCVHEEDMVSELPFGGDERQIANNILKRYCMEHEGEFIAVHEIVSRVKR